MRAIRPGSQSVGQNSALPVFTSHRDSYFTGRAVGLFSSQFPRSTPLPDSKMTTVTAACPVVATMPMAWAASSWWDSTLETLAPRSFYPPVDGTLILGPVGPGNGGVGCFIGSFPSVINLVG